MLKSENFYSNQYFSSVSSATPFGLYLVFLSFFHFSEYYTTSVTNPKSLSLDSFLLNHSPAYHAAAVASWIEFAIEVTFWPQIKTLKAISYAGVAICAAGEVLRKLAMWQVMIPITLTVQHVYLNQHRYESKVEKSPAHLTH